MIYILDSDTCVFALRGRDDVLFRMAALSPDDVAVTREFARVPVLTLADWVS